MSYNPLEPVYEPIGKSLPSKKDQRNDEILNEYMTREIILESDEEMKRRNIILGELKRIFLQWVKSVAIDLKGMTEEEANDVGGTLLISGSHRLGVREPGADIDTICVAPCFCTREEFFRSLKKRLMGNPDVTEINAIETARVPMIGLEFRGVAIDLLFARLSTEQVPDNDDVYHDDKILRNLDSATEISLNGPRVTYMIYKLVEKNFMNQTFQKLLRCVRKWAKKRGLYGNMFGYLGGINCNILCAMICQLYPNGSPSLLLSRFFLVYKDWDWGKRPIMLNKIKENGPEEHRDVWEPQARDLMPMITPAYPASNSSYTVSEYTLEIMKGEFSRGHEVLKSVFSDKPTEPVDKLFEPSDFFIKYNHYLRCNLIGVNDLEDDDETSRGWISYCESRLRHLLAYIGSLPIYPIHFYPVKSKARTSLCYFIGFNVTNPDRELRFDRVIGQFRDGLISKYSGEKVEGLDFTVDHYTWSMLYKQLPAIFEVYGGKAEAKRLRALVPGRVLKKVEKLAEVKHGEECAGDGEMIEGHKDYEEDNKNDLKRKRDDNAGETEVRPQEEEFNTENDGYFDDDRYVLNQKALGKKQELLYSGNVQNLFPDDDIILDLGSENSGDSGTLTKNNYCLQAVKWNI